MSSTIRIDDEVWEWLKRHGRPFEDTPNSVLRRLAGIDPPLTGEQSPVPIPTGPEFVTRSTPITEESMLSPQPQPPSSSRPRLGERVTAKQLNRKYRLGVRHALYHKGGTWYEHLTRFPGALCDPRGYVRFDSEQQFLHDPLLNIGETVNIHRALSAHPRYRLFEGTN